MDFFIKFVMLVIYLQHFRGRMCAENIHFLNCVCNLWETNQWL